jgi:hypothetical protein
VTAGRISQAAVEVLLQAGPSAHVSKQVSELLLRGTAQTRHGQQSIEILGSIVNGTSQNPQWQVVMVILTT